MTDDEIIAVVQAHKEGKRIQYIGVNEADKEINWRDFFFQKNWNFASYEYRVAPEPRKPREFWITNDPHYSPVQYNPFPGAIHVREVIEDE